MIHRVLSSPANSPLIDSLKRAWVIFGLTLLLLPASLLAQSEFRSAADQVSIHLNSHQPQQRTDSSAFDPRLAPFYHGVASGDPTDASVILWTRVTPSEDMTDSIAVTWIMATDTGMTQVVASGEGVALAARDFTLKVEVEGLSPDQYYYYEFFALGRYSLRGRTKTTPVGNVSHLRFAVASCSNYEAGYFNAYARIADRHDLDAVIHLGDYIYEGTNQAPDPDNPRDVVDEEALTLAQYRARYSLYRLDPDLRRAHQQHPFITIWDDHESSNDAWTDGAQAHNPQTDGNWTLRKSVAKQAYFEWLPIRPNADTSIYRTLHYGDLADLIMLDTRLEGRHQQIYDVTDPMVYDTARTMLGIPQRDWLVDALRQSEAQWKLIGNQVIFSPFHIGFASVLPGSGQTADDFESMFLDIWDGYPAERQYLIRQIDSSDLQNLVWLTGDFHCSFAMEVADPVNDPNNNYAPVSTYDRQTGAGAVGVEFVTPSLTSDNFDERLGFQESALLETFINSPLPVNIPNPHAKFVDLDRHGYMVLDLKPDTIQANWYFQVNIDEPNNNELFGQAMYNTPDTNFLRMSAFASSPKATQAVAAPSQVRESQTTSIIPVDSAPVLMGLYPNPVSTRINLQVAQRFQQRLRVDLLDMQGRRWKQLMDGPHAPGIYDVSASTRTLPNGTYLLRITGGGQTRSYKVQVVH